MKLAVLGSDPDILALVEAALAAGHRVVWLGDVRNDDAAPLERLLPGLRISTDWESLLDHRLADAVLVGRGNANETLRAEQLKRLVADIMPVLAVHPVGTSVLAYYELDMARHEVHGVLRHYSPLTGSPAVAELAQWVQASSGEIGSVHQVICQRHLADCGRDSVVRHLARDAEVLRAIAGGVRTVSAVGPRVADASYASLQVQMTGPGTATLRWALSPSSEDAPRVEYTLIGERGTATLELPADPSADRDQYWRPGRIGRNTGVRRTARGDRRARRGAAGQRHRRKRSGVDLAIGYRGDGDRRHDRTEPAKRPHDRSPSAATHRATRLSRDDGRVWLRVAARDVLRLDGRRRGRRCARRTGQRLLADRICWRCWRCFCLMQALPWLVKRRRADSGTANNRRP